MDPDKKTEAVERLEKLVPRGQPTTLAPRFRLTPYTMGDAMEMAKLISGSELCPKAYRGKPQDCILAYEFGAALGLSWMQALRSVSVINGQASLWGDAVPALILGSGDCERFHEHFTGKAFDDDYTAICVMKRKGLPDEIVRTFSVADAKTAKIWQKRGRDGQDTPWITYPSRMLQMRARGFAARDAFPDKLSGLVLAEEAMDYPEAIDATVVSSVIVPESPLLKLSEALQEQIGKAFEAIHASPALRTQKVNEYLLASSERSGQTVDDGATALLEWCRNEFAAQKGRTRGDKKPTDTNGKSSAPVAPPVTPLTGEAAPDRVGRAVETSAPENSPSPTDTRTTPPVVPFVDRVGPSGRRDSAPLTPPPPTSKPVTADEMFGKKAGVSNDLDF